MSSRAKNAFKSRTRSICTAGARAGAARTTTGNSRGLELPRARLRSSERHQISVRSLTPCRRATARASPACAISATRFAHHSAVCLMPAVNRDRGDRARRPSPYGYASMASWIRSCLAEGSCFAMVVVIKRNSSRQHPSQNVWRRRHTRARLSQQPCYRTPPVVRRSRFLATFALISLGCNSGGYTCPSADGGATCDGGPPGTLDNAAFAVGCRYDDNNETCFCVPGIDGGSTTWSCLK